MSFTHSNLLTRKKAFEGTAFLLTMAIAHCLNKQNIINNIVLHLPVHIIIWTFCGLNTGQTKPFRQTTQSVTQHLGSPQLALYQQNSKEKDIKQIQFRIRLWWYPILTK
jgi:hypothetical protein